MDVFQANWDVWSGFSDKKANGYVVESLRAFELGDFLRSEKLALKALGVDANAVPAHVILSKIRMPGLDFLDWLGAIHSYLKPRVYLEIGVGKGLSLQLAAVDCHAVGVDPNPSFDVKVRSSHMTLAKYSSDIFFSEGHADRILNGDGFDLAFIDGCHQFEYALRDFINLEKYSKKGSVILLHDTVPLDDITSTPVRMTTFYSGDVWKLVGVLHLLRPDLTFSTIPTSPTGLTVVSNLNAESTLLFEKYKEIVRRFSSLGWKYYNSQYKAFLHLVPNKTSNLEMYLNSKRVAGRAKVSVK